MGLIDKWYHHNYIFMGHNKIKLLLYIYNVYYRESSKSLIWELLCGLVSFLIRFCVDLDNFCFEVSTGF